MFGKPHGLGLAKYLDPTSPGHLLMSCEGRLATSVVGGHWPNPETAGEYLLQGGKQCCNGLKGNLPPPSSANTSPNKKRLWTFIDS